MQTVSLSAEALALLKLHVEREGDIRVDDANRAIYRELAKAGLMLAGHSFRDGREAFYVFTEEGWSRRADWVRANGPLPSVSASPRP